MPVFAERGALEATAANTCSSAALRGGAAAVAQALIAPMTHTKPKPCRNARRRPFISLSKDVGETAPAMPRLRKFDASNPSSNLPHVNGSRGAAMSTSRAHLRRTSATDTRADVMGAAAPTFDSRWCSSTHMSRNVSTRRSVITLPGGSCASPEPRSGPSFGTGSRRGTDRPGAAEHPTGTGLAGPRLSAGFSAPNGAGVTSNFDGSAAVHTFARAPPDASATTQRPRFPEALFFGQARF